MAVVEIRISLKEGVEDPEGKNTKKALELLGYNVGDVRVSKVFTIEINEHRDVLEVAKDMCKRLLANPVIHNYDIKLVMTDDEKAVQ
ncbi:MAG: phosphoribosylformylglycinamidine synthase subunit PurS [Thermoplasmata archaeon]|nr:MAG: phosphoribosylformylglycinamidine synthase subunit PurS [Thermoplasmata archaeon]